VPITINGKPIRNYIKKGNWSRHNKLPYKVYEEALHLKETHTNSELAKRWGLTKEGAASRLYRARKVLGCR